MTLRRSECFCATFLGNRYYPLEGRIDQLDIEDIAHGLAYQCRFNGQTSDFYSVAQHSILVAQLLPDHLQLAGLLHDAGEAFLGDLVSPIKALLPDFSRLEQAVSAQIAMHFAVNFDAPAIKAADLRLLATEKRDLMPNSVEAWSSLHGIEPLSERIIPWGPATAKNEFLRTYQRLVPL